MPRYVLTQFNSHTLNTHIAENYPPIVFGGPQKRGFVDVLTASQTPKSVNWYKGSADAVRQQLDSILDAFRGMNLPDELLVLSGQAIYKMVTHGCPCLSCPCMLGNAPDCSNAAVQCQAVSNAGCRTKSHDTMHYKVECIPCWLASSAAL